MSVNRSFAFVVGVVALAMNPAFACSSSSGNGASEPYQYGKDEMTAAIRGTWRLTLSRSAGESSITFSLAPGPATTAPLDATPRRAPQCGNREFIGAAGACISGSTLYVAGQVLSADPPIDATAVSGTYSVYSLTYTGGMLRVQLGPTLVMSADLDANNDVTQTYTDEDGARIASRLERVE